MGDVNTRLSLRKPRKWHRYEPPGPNEAHCCALSDVGAVFSRGEQRDHEVRDKERAAKEKDKGSEHLCDFCHDTPTERLLRRSLLAVLSLELEQFSDPWDQLQSLSQADRCLKGGVLVLSPCEYQDFD